MPAKKYLLGAIAALPLFLQSVQAETVQIEDPASASVETDILSTDADATAEPPVVVAPLSAPQPYWSDTADITEAEFPDIYRKIATEVPASANIDGWLEHARILLAGGLFRESAGALERAKVLVGEREMESEQAVKGTDLYLALHAMGVSPDIGTLPGSGASQASGGYFYRLDQLLGLPSPQGVEVLAVASGLARQSPPVVRKSIPILIEAARRSGDIEAARALHAISMETPGVQGTALGYFIGAELLRMDKNPEAAFLEYGKAAAERGEYAIRARLRIAELVLDEPGQKKPALANLQSLIATGLDEWRGDRLTLLMLTRYAEVSERLGDALTALKAMSRILAEFPGQPQAELARGRSVRILAQQVADLDGNALQLAEIVRLFRELAPAMSGLPGWTEARNMLAGKIEDAGLTQMARAEYEAILAGYDRENPDNSRSARAVTLEGLIGTFGDADRPDLKQIIRDHGSEILAKPSLLSALLRAAGPEELEILIGRNAETPYFTGDDYSELGRINFEGGNFPAALAAWEHHLEDGKTLSKGMQSRYYHAKSVVRKGLGNEANSGEPDYLEDLMSSSLKEAPDLTLFDGRISGRMLDDAAAIVELVKTETASATDANNQTTED